MPVIKIDNFGGIMPRQHPTLLGDGMAVVAHNLRLKRGKLIPLRQPALVSGASVLMENGLTKIEDAQSLHVWRKANGSFDFLAFKGVTWMAPGNIADDDKTRVIVTGDRNGDGQTDKPVMYARVVENGVVTKKVVPLVKERLADPAAERYGGSVVETGETKFRGYIDIAGLAALEDVAEGDSYTMTDAGIIEQTVGQDNENIAVAIGTTVVWDGAKWALSERYNAAAVRYTNFYWTWVDGFGYESPVSNPTGEVAYLNGDSIVISNAAPSAEGAVTPAWLAARGAEYIRVYKVIAGTDMGRIQFIYEKKVSELGDATSTTPVSFQFTVKDENAGEVLPNIEAPSADLTCVQDVPGGFYCGFSPSAPKTVMFSDIDLPYSWPVAYRYDVADNLVALAVTSNSVFALTDGWPYVLSGTAPESMSVAKLAGPAACVSPRGVCVYRNAVYYVSNVGLMTIYNSADSGTVCANLTDKMFTKDQWLALNPQSCIMGQHDGALFLYLTAPEGAVYSLSFIDSDGTLQVSRTSHVGLTIDLLDGPTIAVTTHDEAARCLCTDNAEDKMYYVREVR